MGWFTKNKDKKKKEEEEKKKKQAEKQAAQNNANNKRQMEESKQDSSNQIPHQAQQQPEQVDLIKEEDIWIYESILQFLISPVFKAPVHQMIDDKCMYFENTKDISNSHKEIHEDYKNLLNDLVIGLSQDIGVEPDKIMEICELGLNLRAQRKYFIYFQIYYHFEDFVKTLAKRNIDLEQEAFHNMQKRNSNPNNQYQQKRGGALDEDEYEMAIKNSLSNTQNVGGDKELQKAILASQQEFENKKKLQDQEDEMLQQALRLSKIESDSSKNEQYKSSIKHDGHSLSKKIQKPEQKNNQEDDDDLIQINDSDDDDLGDDDDDNLYFDFKRDSSSQPIQQKPDQNFDKMLFESRQNLLKNLDNLNNNSNNQQQQQQKEETLEERKERLKKQREMLLEKKRMERANELDEYADKQIQHQELLMQDEEDDTKSQMEIKKKKDLVNKIKAEIAGNK